MGLYDSIINTVTSQNLFGSENFFRYEESVLYDDGEYTLLENIS